MYSATTPLAPETDKGKQALINKYMYALGCDSINFIKKTKKLTNAEDVGSVSSGQIVCPQTIEREHNHGRVKVMGPIREHLGWQRKRPANPRVADDILCSELARQGPAKLLLI